MGVGLYFLGLLRGLFTVEKNRGVFALMVPKSVTKGGDLVLGGVQAPPPRTLPMFLSHFYIFN